MHKINDTFWGSLPGNGTVSFWERARVFVITLGPACRCWFWRANGRDPVSIFFFFAFWFFFFFFGCIFCCCCCFFLSVFYVRLRMLIGWSMLYILLSLRWKDTDLVLRYACRHTEGRGGGRGVLHRTCSSTLWKHTATGPARPRCYTVTLAGTAATKLSCL